MITAQHTAKHARRLNLSCRCLQVPAPAGEVHAAGGRREVPYTTQLWHLVHVMDRAVVLGFLYSHSAQMPGLSIEYDAAEGAAAGPSAPAAGAAEEGVFSPRWYCGRDGGGNRSNVGLLRLRKAFPGAMKVLDASFWLQTEVHSGVHAPLTTMHVPGRYPVPAWVSRQFSNHQSSNTVSTEKTGRQDVALGSYTRQISATCPSMQCVTHARQTVTNTSAHAYA